ncbi:hypothetical protein ACFLV3_03215 [Chloroflexota bacterium]
MNVLKGLALGLLGFLLFVSLSTLGLAITLNQTILNPDFVAAEIDKLDASSLIKDMIQLPPDAQFMAGTIDKTIDELEPWIKDQVNANVYSGYDYLLGKTESLNIAISTEPVKESLRDNLHDEFMKSIPPELAALSPAQIEQYFDQYYEELSAQIPSTIEFDKNSLPPEVNSTLEQVRQGISYYQIGYWVLIAFTALVIAGIILINRQLKRTTRSIGVTCLIVGAFGFIEAFLSARYAGQLLAQFGDIPVQLQTWMAQLISDFMAPLQTYSIGLLIAGVVLLVVSFVYKPRQPAVEAVEIESPSFDHNETE